jgi:hypothetical protein
MRHRILVIGLRRFFQHRERPVRRVRGRNQTPLHRFESDTA